MYYEQQLGTVHYTDGRKTTLSVFYRCPNNQDHARILFSEPLVRQLRVSVLVDFKCTNVNLTNEEVINGSLGMKLLYAYAFH